MRQVPPAVRHDVQAVLPHEAPQPLLQRLPQRQEEKVPALPQRLQDTNLLHSHRHVRKEVDQQPPVLRPVRVRPL